MTTGLPQVLPAEYRDEVGEDKLEFDRPILKSPDKIFPPFFKLLPVFLEVSCVLVPVVAHLSYGLPRRLSRMIARLLRLVLGT